MGSRRTYFLPVATAPVGSRATALCTVLHVVLWLPAAVLVDILPHQRVLTALDQEEATQGLGSI